MCVVQNLAEAKPSREPDTGEQLQYTKQSEMSSSSTYPQGLSQAKK